MFTRSSRGISRSFVSLLAPLFAGTGGTLLAQDADFIAVIKVQAFEQDRPLLLSLRDEDFNHPVQAPFRFEVGVEASAANALTSGAVLPPGGSSTPLVLDGNGEELNLTAGFEVFSELNDAYGDGTYQVSLVGANDGAKMVSLDFSGNTYVGVPRFTNYAAAQSINAASDFTFQWEAIPGGAATDLVILCIDDEFGNAAFESPFLGEAGALNGLSTSITVPGGTFMPATEYDVVLEVFKPVDSNESYAPGVTAVAAYGKTTFMQLTTTGGVDSLSPFLVRSVPFSFAGGVSTNSIVTFVFNEAMDTGVAAGQAITWTGVADPNLFTYSWSPDGKSLFCDYGPGLPVSTTIQWELNPTGSAAKLRDAAGNNLPGGFLTGEFGTSATSNVGDPDVLQLELGKLKSFFQDGPTPVDLQSYSAGFFVDSTGISTISSVDLGFPGGAVASDIGEFEFFNDAIEGESTFGEKADLDRIYPNGDYVFTMHTAHDGDRSVTLTVGPDSYPNAPTIQNFASTQTIDSSQPFTLQWAPMAGGTTGDLIEVYLEGDRACFFESPGFGEPGVLDGTATSVTIPAHSLPPGRAIEGELVFLKTVDLDTTAYPGVTARAVFVSLTEFEVQTTGDQFQPQLQVQHFGTQATITIIGEAGLEYELLVSDDLGELDTWTQIWSGPVFGSGDCDGFQGSNLYFDDVTGVPKRFYQVREIDSPGP